MQIAANQTLELAPAATGRSSVIAPINVLGDLTWRLISDTDGSIAIAESTDQIIQFDDGRDPALRRYDRPFTAPVTPGRYLAVWRLFDEQEIDQQIAVTAIAPTFATTDDVATRLGRSLSSSELGTVDQLLTQAATVIADAAGYDDGWAATLAPVPRMLWSLSIELVVRGLQNPGQYSQFRQQVGSYSIQVAQDTPGMMLSDAEQRMIRRTVHGTETGSVHVDSGFARAQDEYWLRKQAQRLQSPLAAGETIR